MSMKLFGTTTSPFVRRVRVVAAEVGQTFDLVNTAHDEGQAALRACSPIAKVPVAELGGRVLFDSRVIIDWLTTIHGWGGLQEELNALSKQGKWVEMGTLIDDEVLNTFAVVGEPERIAPELGRRYGDVIQRISFYAPYSSDPDRWLQVLADVRTA